MSSPDTPEPPSLLVGSSEAAEILDVSVATVNRWAGAGVLKAAHRMPGATGARLYLRTDVEALAAQLAARRCPTCGHRLDPPAQPSGNGAAA